MIVRKHIFFSGRVQGVGFRYSATYLARPLELTGWVKNLWDGRVEMEVQGQESAIDSFLSALGRQRYIVIERMEITNLPVVAETRFSVAGY